MIEISDVSKSFGEKRVLQHVTLSASSGEILCLLGPSGAGKTTLIRLITGAIAADSGRILFDGRRIPTMDSIRRIGYMPQEDAVYHDITGYDNLMFFGRMYGLRGNELKGQVEEMFSLVDLAGEKDVLVSRYSGGMKKRLSLAVSLLHDPEILLLDEPTVGIDPLLRKTIWGKFDDLCHLGKTLIISTHVMDEAEKCTKAALIYGGGIIEYGEVGALKSKTASGSLEELFFRADGTEAVS